MTTTLPTGCHNTRRSGTTSYDGDVSALPVHRPYLPGPFRWRLGLRPLDVDDWIEIRDDHDHQMAVKAQVLADHHATAFGAIEGVESEATEVLEALVDHLRHRFPARYASVEPHATVHPLDAAGRLVQEDLALLVERDGQLVFGAGSICFPNRWDLRSKLGLPLHDVHAPVARLNAELAGPIDRFFERLTPERSFWRLGWGILDTPELYQAVDGTAPSRPLDSSTADVGFDDLHLRVERETVRRFPRTGAVLFTIRTHITTLRDLVTEPAETALLAEAVAAMPDDVARYKQLDELGGRIVAWLREIEIADEG